MTRRVAAAVLLAALGALAGAPALAAGPGEVDRVLKDRRITEASGLAVSARHDGVLWTHEDSGTRPRLFAVDRAGKTVATVTVAGVENVDWEALAPGSDAAGRPVLAIGDIGDNRARRERIRIVVVPEPALADATVRPVRELDLRYPEGAADAEALLAHPATGRLYVVTKSLLGATMFAVPEAAWPGSGRAPGNGWVLEPVADVNFGLVTDGAFLPDGRFVLRNYGGMGLFAPLDPAAPAGTVLRPLARANLPDQPQGEAIAVAPGGREVLVHSEGAGQPVLRVPLPAAAAPDATGGAAGEGGADEGAAGEDSGTPAPTTVAAPAVPWEPVERWAPVVIGVVLLGGLVTLVVALARR